VTVKSPAKKASPHLLVNQYSLFYTLTWLRHHRRFTELLLGLLHANA